MNFDRISNSIEICLVGRAPGVAKVSDTVAYFTEEVNLRLGNRPLKINGRLANLGLTSLVKEITGN